MSALRTRGPTLVLFAATAALATNAQGAWADTGPAAAATPAHISAARKKSPYQPEGVPRSGRNFLAMTSGVGDMRVRLTNAGNLVRFTYRVTNAEQAKVLNDRQTTPYMIGHTSHAMLKVPVMDKVGPLRQAFAPEVGKEYWMVFSNKGDVVKKGERVSVVVGSFRVDGLVVE